MRRASSRSDTKVSPLDVVEAAYALEADEDTWYRELAKRVAALLDEGYGVEAVRFDLQKGRVTDPVVVGGTAEWQRSWRENWWEPLMQALDGPQLRFATQFGQVFYSSALWRAAHERDSKYRRLLSQLGGSGWGEAFGQFATRPVNSRLFYPDSLNVLAVDPSSVGLGFFSQTSQLASRPVPAEKAALWTKLSGHIVAALRLRAKLQSTSYGEAVIHPNGRLEHVEGPARRAAAQDSLRRATQQVDRARTRRIRKTDEALELWRALHAGRWSLVETFESDGRRYYIARPNVPSPPARSFSNLSERERQVVSLLALGRTNKAISYELGLSTSTVATLLRRAAARLGLRNAMELGVWARRELVHET
ncbi:MAG: LuxR C-terminal-related transcriptional regulator [Polyangiaceae bacterium]